MALPTLRYLRETPTTAPPDDNAGAYAPPGPGPADSSRDGGWLLFGRQGTLVARRFDAARGALSGDPVTVADALATDAGRNVGAFSVSATGLVTYRVGGVTRTQLTWFDRAGQALETLGAPTPRSSIPPCRPMAARPRCGGRRRATPTSG